MLLQRALAAKNTVSVTFGAPLFGPQIRSFCNCSEYVTFPTMPATMVRELTACVTFGAPRVGVPMASRRRPIFGHQFGMACGDVFWANAITNLSKASACVTTLKPNETSIFVFLTCMSQQHFNCIGFGSGVVAWSRQLRYRRRLLSVAWSLAPHVVPLLVRAFVLRYLIRASRGVFSSSPLVY